MLIYLSCGCISFVLSAREYLIYTTGCMFVSTIIDVPLSHNYNLRCIDMTLYILQFVIFSLKSLKLRLISLKQLMLQIITILLSTNYIKDSKIQIYKFYMCIQTHAPHLVRASFKIQSYLYDSYIP